MYDNKDSSEKRTFFDRLFHRRTKRLLTQIDKMFAKLMWLEIGLSAILTLFGVIFLLFPEASVKITSVLFGMVVFGFGLVNIYAYMKRRLLPFFKYNLYYGIAGVVLGIITMIYPIIASQVITIFIGLWILYMAVVVCDFAIRLRSIGEKSWIFLLTSAILEVLMAILIFVNPFANLALTQVAGAYFVLAGILNTTNAIMRNNRSEEFLDLIDKL